MMWFMMRLLIAATLTGDGGKAPEQVPGVTSVPPTYLLAYSPDASGNPAFIEDLRAAPPDLLHLGHTVPLNSIFGPTADYGGFNPKLVTATEILGRKDELRAFVERLHAAGVTNVICYINPSILGGDHQTRAGFWAFYDHWDDYAALGLGPKPERAPELWMQRERRSFAPWEPDPNYSMWRYEPCINEPAWVQYQRAVVRLIAECGYDGVFVDDCIMECRHDICAQRFPAFVQSRCPGEILAAAFPDGIRLEPEGRGPGRGEDTLRAAETCAFWQESMTDFLGEMNAVGQAVHPAFFTLPNWGATGRVGGAASRIRNGKGVAAWRRASTLQMFEEDHPSGQFGASGDVAGYLLQYNYGLGLGVRPAVLSYGSARPHVELGYAEAAAGGGGAYVQTGTAFPDIRRKWRAFYAAHRDLFEGFTLAAPVGLILSFDEPRFGNDEHLREAYAAARALYRAHIPFAAVAPENLRRGGLGQHRVILAPEVRHLSDAQYEALEGFVQQGGRLLVSGAFAAFDQFANPRTDASIVFGPAASARRKPPRIPAGQGAAFRVDSLDAIVPEREFAHIRALEERELDALRQALDALESRPPAVQDPSEASFKRWVETLAGEPLALTDAAPGVLTVMYQRVEGDAAVFTLHAVRYAASPVGPDPCGAPAAPLQLTIPIPEGWQVETIATLAPESEAAALAYRIHSRRVKCEIPPFEYYRLVSLKLSTVRPCAAQN
jgi:hypothetical protein